MRLLCRVLVCLGYIVGVSGLVLGAGGAGAQTTFKTVVVFGDSLSDTGNIAHLVQNATFGLVRYPSDNQLLGFDYTDGRFTDGKDTQPAAQAYLGLWIEQLAGSFPAKPGVTDSLDGGTNFAYGDATTANGSTTVSEGIVSITLDNMGQQVTDYMSRSPAPVPNAQTLYVLWGGANDIYNAVKGALGSGSDPTAAATAAANLAVANEGGLIQQLVQAGATNFLVPNLPPLGSVPEYATTAGSAALNTGAQAFRTALATELAMLQTADAAKGIAVNFYQPDIYTQYSSLVASPTAAGLGNVTDAAQHISGDPDVYLSWDGLHPTTTGHHFAAATAANLLSALVASGTTLTAPAAILAGQTATLTAKVTSAGSSTAIPSGLVTFFNGTTVVGATALDATGAGTATLSGATVAASPYKISAVYAGDTTYAVSSSAAVSVTVLAAPIGTSTSLNVGLISTGTGQQADLTATVMPASSAYGSASGTVTFYDGATSLGTGTLSSGVATLTTAALAVGAHSFTASYAAAGIFAGSTSTAVPETIVGIGFTPAANPSSLTIKDGGTGTTALTAVGTGGYFGPLTLSCGTLPAHITCTFSSPSYSIPNPATTVLPSPVTLTIGTMTTSALDIPGRPGARGVAEVFPAALLLPGFAATLLFGLRRRVRLSRGIWIASLMLIMSAGAVFGLAGCGANPDAAKGTYTIPVVFTPASGSGVPAETLNVSVTVN